MINRKNDDESMIMIVLFLMIYYIYLYLIINLLYNGYYLNIYTPLNTSNFYLDFENKNEIKKIIRTHLLDDICSNLKSKV